MVRLSVKLEVTVMLLSTACIPLNEGIQPLMGNQKQGAGGIPKRPPSFKSVSPLWRAGAVKLGLQCRESSEIPPLRPVLRLKTIS